MEVEESKNLMTEGTIWKKIMFFALPLFFGNLFQQLYNTADSLIVGNFLGSNALAAVSSSGNLKMCIRDRAMASPMPCLRISPCILQLKF